MTSIIKAYTVADLAAESGKPTWRVQYIIRTRHIDPVERVGIFRLFDESGRQFVLAELQRIKGRGGSHAK